MYSQQLTSLIEGRRFLLTIFWLILPFEVFVFSALAFILRMTMPVTDPAISLGILSIAAAVMSLSSVGAGAFIRSMFFRQKLDFDNPVTAIGNNGSPETPVLASLSNPEKVIILAYRTNISLFVLTNSMLSFPTVMGMIVTMLSGNPLPITIAVVISLLCWKTLVLAPADFISRFHQHVDPQYIEFLKQQNP